MARGEREQHRADEIRGGLNGGGHLGDERDPVGNEDAAGPRPGRRLDVVTDVADDDTLARRYAEPLGGP